jgi:ParB family chromosome partitioning protein
MSKKSALGKGFDGLIPTGFNVGEVASPGETIKKISISKLVANPDQPRRTFDENSLLELAESIKTHGIIQPIVVTPHKNDTYRIVAGERRFRASKIASLEFIPAIVRNHEELEELEIALVENVQRVDLSPIEQAVSIIRLRDQFSLTPTQIAKKLGKAETTISNIVRLLQLPKKAIDALQKNTITEGHARTILSLKTDEKLQLELLNNIITQKMTVRDAEDFVKQHRRTPAQKKTVKNPKLEQLMSRVNPTLKKTMKVKEKNKDEGQIQLHYCSQEEFEKIMDRLK